MTTAKPRAETFTRRRSAMGRGDTVVRCVDPLCGDERSVGSHRGRSAAAEPVPGRVLAQPFAPERCSGTWVAARGQTAHGLAKPDSDDGRSRIRTWDLFLIRGRDPRVELTDRQCLWGYSRRAWPADTPGLAAIRRGLGSGMGLLPKRRHLSDRAVIVAALGAEAEPREEDVTHAARGGPAPASNGPACRECPSASP